MSAAKPAHPSDRDLVLAMAAGTVDALRGLNTRYGGMLTALAMRFVGNELDAEEVAGDVLWQAWREARLYDPNRGSVGAWLVTLTRTRAIDRLRAMRTRSGSPEHQAVPEPFPDPSSELDLAERVRAVRSALTAIDPKERMALELAYFSDMSHSEIAEKLEIPIGTVKTRIRNAMIKLRNTLSGSLR